MSVITKFNIIKRCFLRLHGYGLQSVRNMNQQKSPFAIFKKFKASESKFKVKDGVPEHYNLIYRHAMSNYLLGSQVVSVLGCAIVGIYVVMADTSQEYELHLPGTKKQPIPVDQEVLVYLTALLTLSVFLQYLIQKSPIRIYNNPQNERYLFVYYNVLPFMTKQVKCGLKDISKLTFQESFLRLWSDSKYVVKNNSGVILLENFFKTPAELNIMLGLQKRFSEATNGKEKI